VFTRVEWVGSWPVRSYVEGRLALQALPMLRSSDIWHRPVDPGTAFAQTYHFFHAGDGVVLARAN